MMSFHEYEDQNGEPFLLIGNHGGISISRDFGQNNKNIGLIGLNVSPYSDVRTLPSDPNRVFAEAQDQGFQRGYVQGVNPVFMVQVFSGDYGHITFTENGQRMWAIYPGGNMSYLRDPIAGGVEGNCKVESENESVWIPPLMADPDPSKNAIYMAGGDTDGGSGVHIIRIEKIPTQNDLSVSQLPFDFSPFIYVVEDEEWYNLGDVVAPTVLYWSVEYVAETKIARFGTYGRGIWDFQLKESTSSIEDFQLKSGFTLFPNPVSDGILNISIDYKPATDMVFRSMTGQELGRYKLEKD